MKKIFLSTLLLLVAFSGCSDNNATITKSEKDLHHIKCMRLVIFPPNKFLQTTMKKLYNFDTNCSYKLKISQKSGIVCNSNQNADRKALSNFPSGFIRLDLYKGYKNIYSYYRDLTHKTTEEDVKKAFESLRESMN